LESYYKFAKIGLNIVHNTENSFAFYLPSVYRKRELRWWKMSTDRNKFAIFQYQFTSTVYWTSSRQFS